MKLLQRRKTYIVNVNGVFIGHKSPVVIQSMTNTPTENIKQTLYQTIELIKSGAELVRWTINNVSAAIATPKIISKLREKGYSTPIIGDFHYNGHILLDKYPECARALSKYRINPGNVGKGNLHDNNFSKIIKIATENKKPIRIGVNSGSIDPEILAKMMSANSKIKRAKSYQDILIKAMVKSALSSAQYAIKLGLNKNKIILSVKMSDLQDMVEAYTQLAYKCRFPLHLGLTEAGSDIEGIISSSSALSILLQQGIGDTIRVSLTPQQNTKRSKEVDICKILLQSLGIRYFKPKVISCPGCGRTESKEFQKLAQYIKSYIDKKLPVWKKQYTGIESLKIAVMGCIVNGPGESKNANIGISLPGKSENPIAPVYADRKKIAVLTGANIRGQFIDILEKYIKTKYKRQ